jgi:cation transport regulator ChaB
MTRLIALLLRPIRIRRARAAYNAALEAVKDAHERKDTRAQHAAHRRAMTALHALMAVEQGR